MKLRRNGYSWSDVRKLDNSIVHKVLVWLGWRRSPSLAGRNASKRAAIARKAFNDGLLDDPRAVHMTVVRGRWFPASVVLPGQQSRPWQRCYALATDTDLHLFRRPSEAPDWSSPIVWDTTTLPVKDRDARRGFDVHTSDGLVVVTLGTGCRCGPLGRWAGPGWARTETVRA